MATNGAVDHTPHESVGVALHGHQNELIAWKPQWLTSDADDWWLGQMSPTPFDPIRSRGLLFTEIRAGSRQGLLAWVDSESVGKNDLAYVTPLNRDAQVTGLWELNPTARMPGTNPADRAPFVVGPTGYFDPAHITANLVYHLNAEYLSGHRAEIQTCATVATAEGKIPVYDAGGRLAAGAPVNACDVARLGDVSNVTAALTTPFIPYWDGTKLADSALHNEFDSALALNVVESDGPLQLNPEPWGDDQTFKIRLAASSTGASSIFAIYKPLGGSSKKFGVSWSQDFNLAWSFVIHDRLLLNTLNSQTTPEATDLFLFRDNASKAIDGIAPTTPNDGVVSPGTVGLGIAWHNAAGRLTTRNAAFAFDCVNYGQLTGGYVPKTTSVTLVGGNCIAVSEAAGGADLSVNRTWTIAMNCTFEPPIVAGVASQFWGWDKTWRDIDWGYIVGKPATFPPSPHKFGEHSDCDATFDGTQPTGSVPIYNTTTDKWSARILDFTEVARALGTTLAMTPGVLLKYTASPYFTAPSNIIEMPNLTPTKIQAGLPFGVPAGDTAQPGFFFTGYRDKTGLYAPAQDQVCIRIDNGLDDGSQCTFCFGPDGFHASCPIFSPSILINGRAFVARVAVNYTLDTTEKTIFTISTPAAHANTQYLLNIVLQQLGDFNADLILRTYGNGVLLDTDAFNPKLEKGDISIAELTPGVTTGITWTVTGQMATGSIVVGASDQQSYFSIVMFSPPFGGGGSGGGGITGTGTQNRHAKWTSATDLTSGLIWDDGTNMGLGNSAVAGRFLTVHGDTTFKAELVKESPVATTTALPVWVADAPGIFKTQSLSALKTNLAITFTDIGGTLTAHDLDFHSDVTISSPAVGQFLRFRSGSPNFWGNESVTLITGSGTIDRMTKWTGTSALGSSSWSTSDTTPDRLRYVGAASANAVQIKFQQSAEAPVVFGGTYNEYRAFMAVNATQTSTSAETWARSDTSATYSSVGLFLEARSGGLEFRRSMQNTGTSYSGFWNEQLFGVTRDGDVYAWRHISLRAAAITPGDDTRIVLFQFDPVASGWPLVQADKDTFAAWMRPTLQHDLTDHGDVTITDPAGGQVLTYDGTLNIWRNITTGTAESHTHPYYDVKFQAIPRLLGRTSADDGSGLTGEEVSVDSSLTLTNRTLSVNWGAGGIPVGGTPSTNSVTIDAPTAGVAATFIRTDATLQLDQAIAPYWTAKHTFHTGSQVYLNIGVPFSLELALTTTPTSNNYLLITDGNPVGYPARVRAASQAQMKTWLVVPLPGTPPANSVKLAAAAGSATTYMRSDATLDIDEGIAPIWTAKHRFNPSGGSGLSTRAPSLTPLTATSYVLVTATTPNAVDADIRSADLATMKTWLGVGGSGNITFTNKNVLLGTDEAAPGPGIEIEMDPTLDIFFDSPAGKTVLAVKHAPRWTNNIYLHLIGHVSGGTTFNGSVYDVPIDCVVDWSQHGLDTHADVDVSTVPPVDGQVLTYDSGVLRATPGWYNATASVAWTNITGKPATFPPDPHALGSHSDTTIGTPTNGQFIQYSTATSKWVNATVSIVPTTRTLRHFSTTADLTISPNTAMDLTQAREWDYSVVWSKGYPTYDARYAPVGGPPVAHYHFINEVLTTFDFIVLDGVLFGSSAASSGAAPGEMIVFNTTELAMQAGPTLRVVSAPKWTTPRTLSWTKDATGSMSVNGAADASAQLTVVWANAYPTLDTKYVPLARTLTIGGGGIASVTPAGPQDLSANRSWTVTVAAPDLSGYVPTSRTLTLVAGTGISIAPTGAQSLTTDRSWTITNTTTAQDLSIYALKATTLAHTSANVAHMTISPTGPQDLSTGRGWTHTIVSAPKWTTARTLTWTKDATGTMSLDGSVDASAQLTVVWANGYVTYDARYALIGHTHTGYEPTIPASTASKFYAWDKTFKDVDWAYIVNKPASLPPSAHKHPYSDVTLSASPALIGRTTAGAGDAELINVGATLLLSAQSLSVVSAPKWTTARTFTWTGDATGTMTGVDGQANATAAITVVWANGYATYDLRYALTSHTHAGVYEPVIAASTASKFYSWDKTWRDIDWAYITNKPTGLPPTPHTHPYSEVNNVTSGRLLGRTTAAVGVTELITVDGNLSLAGLLLSVLSAPKWTSGRLLSWSKDATGSMTVDGSANVDAQLTVVWANSYPTLDTKYVPLIRTLTLVGSGVASVTPAGAQDLTTNRSWTITVPATDLSGYVPIGRTLTHTSANSVHLTISPPGAQALNANLTWTHTVNAAPKLTPMLQIVDGTAVPALEAHVLGFWNATGSSGFPSTTGCGLDVIRHSSATSQTTSFQLWSGTGTDIIGKVWHRYITNSLQVWSSWRALAFEDQIAPYLYRQLAAGDTTVRWVRIASFGGLVDGAGSGVSRANGRFILRINAYGSHEYYVFSAGVSYSTHPTIVLHNSTAYAIQTVRKIRILEAVSTSAGAALDVEISGQPGGIADLYVYLLENLDTIGWTLKAFEEPATIPTGYTAWEFDLTGATVADRAIIGTTTESGANAYKVTRRGAISAYSLTTVFNGTIGNNLTVAGTGDFSGTVALKASNIAAPTYVATFASDPTGKATLGSTAMSYFAKATDLSNYVLKTQTVTLTQGANIIITGTATQALSGNLAWTISGTGGGGVAFLTDLSDVTITAPVTNEVLRYNGSQWVNAALSGTVLGSDPSVSIGLTMIPGSATTYMRSDAAPALSQAIAPTWSAKHIFNAGPPAVALRAGAATLVAASRVLVVDDEAVTTFRDVKASTLGDLYTWLGLGSYVPTSRTLTLVAGTGISVSLVGPQNLTQDRSWTITNTSPAPDITGLVPKTTTLQHSSPDASVVISPSTATDLTQSRAWTYAVDWTKSYPTLDTKYVPIIRTLALVAGNGMSITPTGAQGLDANRSWTITCTVTATDTSGLVPKTTSLTHTSANTTYLTIDTTGTNLSTDRTWTHTVLAAPVLAGGAKPDANTTYHATANRFHSFYNTTGSTNYPTSFGGGFMFERLGTGQGAFQIWTELGTTEALYWKKMTAGSTWGTWKKFVFVGDTGTGFVPETRSVTLTAGTGITISAPNTQALSADVAWTISSTLTPFPSNGVIGSGTTSRMTRWKTSNEIEATTWDASDTTPTKLQYLAGSPTVGIQVEIGPATGNIQRVLWGSTQTAGSVFISSNARQTTTSVDQWEMPYQSAGTGGVVIVGNSWTSRPAFDVRWAAPSSVPGTFATFTGSIFSVSSVGDGILKNYLTLKAATTTSQTHVLTFTADASSTARAITQTSVAELLGASLLTSTWVPYWDGTKLADSNFRRTTSSYCEFTSRTAAALVVRPGHLRFSLWSHNQHDMGFYALNRVAHFNPLWGSVVSLFEKTTDGGTIWNSSAIPSGASGVFFAGEWDGPTTNFTISGSDGTNGFRATAPYTGRLCTTAFAWYTSSTVANMKLRVEVEKAGAWGDVLATTTIGSAGNPGWNIINCYTDSSTACTQVRITFTWDTDITKNFTLSNFYTYGSYLWSTNLKLFWGSPGNKTFNTRDIVATGLIDSRSSTTTLTANSRVVVFDDDATSVNRTYKQADQTAFYNWISPLFGLSGYVPTSRTIQHISENTNLIGVTVEPAGIDLSVNRVWTYTIFAAPKLLPHTLIQDAATFPTEAHLQTFWHATNATGYPGGSIAGIGLELVRHASAASQIGSFQLWSSSSATEFGKLYWRYVATSAPTWSAWKALASSDDMTGTVNRIPKWGTTTSFVNSSLIDSGTLVTCDVPLTVTGTVTSNDRVTGKALKVLPGGVSVHNAKRWFAHGAAYTHGNPISGNILIKLPITATSSGYATMMRLDIQLIDYRSGGLDTILSFSGYTSYTSATAATWVYPKAVVNNPLSVISKVKVGYDKTDGNKWCICIKSSAGTWGYPNVHVDAFIGYTGSNNAVWESTPTSVTWVNDTYYTDNIKEISTTERDTELSPTFLVDTSSAFQTKTGAMEIDRVRLSMGAIPSGVTGTMTDVPSGWARDFKMRGLNTTLGTWGMAGLSIYIAQDTKINRVSLYMVGETTQAIADANGFDKFPRFDFEPDGDFIFHKLSTASGKFVTGGVTAARIWTMPDKTGTVAMTSDIGVGNVSGSGTEGYMPVWTASTTGLANSTVSVSGSTIKFDDPPLGMTNSTVTALYGRQAGDFILREINQANLIAWLGVSGGISFPAEALPNVADSGGWKTLVATSPLSLTLSAGDYVLGIDLSGYAPASHTHDYNVGVVNVPSDRLVGRYPTAGVGVLQPITIGAGLELTSGGDLYCTITQATGTVTSIGMTAVLPLQVTPASISTNGTFALTWASQTAKHFFMAPNAAAGVPSFRAVAASDLGTGTPSGTTYLNGLLAWTTMPSFLTSATLTPASYFTDTSTGTTARALSFAWVTTIAQRQFLVGPPTTGAATAAPTFRTIVAKDLAVNATTDYILSTTDGTTLTWIVKPTGGGGGNLSGGGSTGTIAMWSGAESLDNSAITQGGSGNDIYMTGHLTLTGGLKYFVAPRLSISDQIEYGSAVLPKMPNDSAAGKLWAITGQGSGAFTYSQFSIPTVPDVPSVPGSDNRIYTMRNSNWFTTPKDAFQVDIPGLYALQVSAGPSHVWATFNPGIQHATSNGSYYASRNGTWEAFTPGGGSGVTGSGAQNTVPYFTSGANPGVLGQSAIKYYTTPKVDIECALGVTGATTFTSPYVQMTALTDSTPARIVGKVSDGSLIGVTVAALLAFIAPSTSNGKPYVLVNGAWVELTGTGTLVVE